MTRAEQKAEEYCKKMNYLNDVRDKQEDGTLYHSLEAGTAIDAYVTAYKQAKKDLALTWEDLRAIYEIFDALDNEHRSTFNMGIQQYFQEALRRFTESKITESL